MKACFQIAERRISSAKIIKKLRIIVRNRVFFVLSSFSVKKSHSRMKNKVSISSLNQIFAVPLQAESPWQNSQRLIFLSFYTFIFNVQINF
jgi:hypothetical protein